MKAMIVKLGGERIRMADESRLSATARSVSKKARRDSTLAAYYGDLLAFGRWADERQLDPWDESTAAEFLASLVRDEKRMVATVNAALTAIRFAYKKTGRPVPIARGSWLSDVLKGARREAIETNPPGRAPALRVDDWRLAMLALGRQKGARSARDRALLALAYLGCLRKSEAVALNVGDVEVRPEGLAVTIRRSKASDVPQVVLIPRGAADGGVCPVRAWLDWQATREPGLPGFEAGEPALVAGSSGPRGWLRSVRIGGGHTVERILRAALKAANVPNPERYTAHSLRAGLATSLAASGVPLPIIAQHGRWRSHATAMGYANRVERWGDSPLRSLGY